MTQAGIIRAGKKCISAKGISWIGLLFVTTLVYCVLTVHLFSARSPDYFRDLSTALLSLHQVVTGGSWSSGIARSLFKEDAAGNVETDAGIAFFFICYILIANVLLLSAIFAQLREMMRGELVLFAQGGLWNAFKESENGEFQQTVLLLQMMETKILGRMEQIEDKVQSIVGLGRGYWEAGEAGSRGTGGAGGPLTGGVTLSAVMHKLSLLCEFVLLSQPPGGGPASNTPTGHDGAANTGVIGGLHRGGDSVRGSDALAVERARARARSRERQTF